MYRLIVASGPVIVENNKVLLDKDYKEDIWKFCGGKIKEDENLIDTARRRPKEELGIDVEILDENPFIIFSIKETPKGKIDVSWFTFWLKKLEKSNQKKTFENGVGLIFMIFQIISDQTSSPL